MNLNLVLTGAAAMNLGALITIISQRFERHRRKLEDRGSLFLIGGVTLIAFATPWI